MQTALRLIRDLDSLAEAINREHHLSEEAASCALAHSRRTTDLLLHAKDRVPPREWIPWLEANCEFSPRTARAYLENRRRPAPRRDGLYLLCLVILLSPLLALSLLNV